MSQTNTALVAFNRGIISPKALSRIDIERVELSAETQENWMPRSLGSMTLRPGFKYLGATKSNNTAYFIPFVYSTSETALIEFTDLFMRVWAGDSLVTRPTVTAAVTNGTFTSDVSGWTDSDEAGGVSTWKTGGYLSLVSNGTASAKRIQQITVTETSVEHALRIVINRGPVRLRLGSTSGGKEYLEATLLTGEHSIALTPTADFYITFSSTLIRETLVGSVAIEAAGIVSIPSPYIEADLPYIRDAQSADVIYLACAGYKQKKIERRTQRSWSLVDYDSDNGPFDTINTGPITIASSALSGNVTLTANKDLFVASHIGGLFRLESTSQEASVVITAENTFTTEDVKVTGVGTGRALAVSITGTFSATVTLERSIGAPGAWVEAVDWATAGARTHNDGLDNQIVYYRIGVKTGEFTSGSVTAAITFAGGTAVGVVRITAVASGTSASAEVVDALGATDATDLWYEGLWSTKNGYPSSVALYEGRLWWAGKNYWYGSVSDDYANFSFDTIGDSGPIIRVIGFGPVDNIHWLLPLGRLLAGTPGSEVEARSSSFDEPLTPTNFSMKDSSTQGSSPINAVRIDNRGIFVQRGDRRLIETSYSGESNTYQPVDLMLTIPEIAAAGIKKIAVQRQPDTRVHVILNDGTALVFITDPAENLRAWVTVTTDGTIDDVVVLPGNEEDQVYYTVNRTGGRYLEKWALESECVGGSFNKQADSFILSTGQTITGLGHLEGKTVVVWADGVDRGTFVVASGSITLAASYTNVVVGLAYNANYVSGKLSFALGMDSYTGLTQKKRVCALSLIMVDTHAQGVKYGSDASYLDSLPLMEDGKAVDVDSIWSYYDKPSFEFNGSWLSDARLYLRASAPRPATIAAAVITQITQDKR